MADVPTSLDPLETSIHRETSPTPPPIDLPCASDIHAGTLTTRELIASVLRDLAMRGTVPMRRPGAFEDCGSRYVLLRHKDERSRYRICATSCHDRLCPACGRQRGRDLARGLRSILGNQTWRFVTLTLGGDRHDLKASLDRLYAGFKKLRQSSLWKSHVNGGVAVLETTFNAQSGEWHPHLHILVSGTFIPQPALSEAWLAATLDSKIVDISLVRSHQSVAHYLTEYLGKPLPPSVLDSPERIAEAALALAGVRRIVAFGTCHGHTRLQVDEESPWQRVGDVAFLLHSDERCAMFKALLRSLMNVCHDENSAVEFEWTPDG